MSVWYETAGDDVVVSTRVRLARNCKDFPFRPSAEQVGQITEQVKAALDRGSFPYETIAVDALDGTDRQALLEQHLISQQLAQYGGTLLLGEDKTTAIMLGEEDHIRIQCILPGLALDEAYQTADRVDDLIGEQVDYAFSGEFGYLTHCPTNVGTGLRASVMLHLPALSMSGKLRNIMAAVPKLGITVRGFYGEGTEASGCLYQFSNQVTLGLSEREIIGRLKEVVGQVTELERSERTQLYGANKLQLEDRVWRAYGTLRYAKLLTSGECMNLLSDVRLGVSLGILPGLSIGSLTKLMIQSEPANLMETYGKDLTPAQRDEKRASLAAAVLGAQ